MTSYKKKEDSYPICEPEGPRLQEPKGPARSCETLSGYKDFHGGGGLCSRGDGRKKLGSWLVLATERVEASYSGICGLRKKKEREAFRMASGEEANWKVARDEGLQKKLLEVIRH